ncbi:MAG: diguanylate cyclase [Caldimonas sp.]
MKPTADPIESGVAALAARELDQLQKKVGETRAILNRLQQDVVEAGSRLGSTHASQLLEANEQLVLAMLRADAEAETGTQALHDLSRSAELDALTQLPNRALLRDRLARAIAGTKRRKSRLALLFLDINNFKQINDTLGHAVGDEVLKLVGARLASSVRAADTVSRHSGDEFVILLSEVSQASDALLIADKVLAALAAPSRIGEHVLRLTASIGISLYPDDGNDADTLIDRADAAMYRAKRGGLGSLVFHEEPGEPGGPPDERTVEALPLASLQQPLSRYEQALDASKHRHAQMREANEQLVLAALGAQTLQAAAEQAQRRQTDFLAVLAHELRNPLAPIRTAAATLASFQTDEPMLPRMQAVIERQVVHLSRLVDDLLDVSRVSTGKLRLVRGPVEMRATIDTAVDACRPAMDMRMQRFDISLPASALTIDGDPVRLAQIVSNLLDNASKYTPDGGEIRLAAEVVGGSAVITVTDSGIGISAEALPHVFDPFVQDTHAIGFNGAGLGIGLTVVRELVEAHGGSVVASSAGSGHGSRFVVTLPLLAGST